MISYLDKLNLRPAEKRLVVVAALAFFGVLNFIFVVPQFGEWGRTEQKIRDAQARLDKYAVEVNRQTLYKKEFERLRKIGQSIPAEDQALDMSKTVTSQAALSGVSVQSLVTSDRKANSGAKTNLFFEEKSGSLTVNATEQQLVDFLYLLGSGDSLIRARSMTVTPDPTKMRLNATMTLAASYQRKPPPKPGTSPSPNSGTTNSVVTPSAVSPFKAPPTLPKPSPPSKNSTNAAPPIPKPK